MSPPSHRPASHSEAELGVQSRGPIPRVGRVLALRPTPMLLRGLTGHRLFPRNRRAGPCWRRRRRVEARNSYKGESNGHPLRGSVVWRRRGIHDERTATPAKAGGSGGHRRTRSRHCAGVGLFFTPDSPPELRLSSQPGDTASAVATGVWSVDQAVRRRLPSSREAASPARL